MARKRSPYLTQAQAMAVVRYSPEESALVALLKQAQDTFHQGVAAARGSARYATGVIDRSRPRLEHVYDVPGLNPAQAVAAPTPPPAGSLDFHSAAQFEQQAATRRLLQSRTDALAGLEEQKAATAAGAQFGTQQARQTYQHDVGTIADRLVQLSGQKGAFIVSQLGTLEKEAAQRALTRRGQDVTRLNALTSSGDRQATLDETRRHNRVTELNDGSGRPKLATPTQHGDFQDAVGSAIREAKRLKENGGHSRSYVAKTLLLGRSEQTVTNPDDPSQKAKIPGVPKQKELVARVALDLVYDGHVSPDTVRRLHSRRFSVKKLGLPTRRDFSSGTSRQVASALRF